MAVTLTVGPKDQALIQGTLLFGPTGATALPNNCIDDANIEAGAGVQAAKLQHQLQKSYGKQGAGAAIVADTGTGVHVARNAGTIAGIQASIFGTIATGADRTVSIDLQKRTGSGAFASVLSAAISVDHTATLGQVFVGTVTTPTYLAGDVFQIVVTVAGAAGNQAIGLLADAAFVETGA